MNEAVKILQQILNDISSHATTHPSAELLKLSLLKNYFNLPIYNYQSKFNFPTLEDAQSAGNYLYAQALKFYNIKEYQKAYEVIFSGLYDQALPINLLIVKLFIASIQGLKLFNEAALMYKSYYQLTGEIDALFFAGICNYWQGNKPQAQQELRTFVLTISDSLPLKNQYQRLLNQATRLINTEE